MELKEHQHASTTATPKKEHHPFSWWLKWASSVVLIFAMIVTTNNLYPWNMFLQFEREARLQVKKEREEAEKRRKKKLNLVKNIAITFLFVVLVGAIITIGLMIFLSANQ